MTQPMGRKPYRSPSKTDCHPPKGYVNWWEVVIEPNKTAAKREAEAEIKTEIEQPE